MESQRLCISLNSFLWSIYLSPTVLLNGTVETILTRCIWVDIFLFLFYDLQ